ncbi:MAG: hypothetical protein KAR54_01220 [Candidatus Pacebacteria bacterium]|nr:hypothetical protein [Candidatus Paceibacterota bacterium]
MNIKKIIFITIPIFLIIILFYWFFLRETDRGISFDDFTVLFPSGEVDDIDLGREFRERQEQDQIDGIPITSQDIYTEDLILRKISSNPVVNAIIFEDISSKTTINEDKNYIIRYIEKITGHIYETTTKSLIQNRISNTTIPKINKVLWIDKDNLIIRYIEEDIIKTFSANLVEDSNNELSLEGVYLQDNIREIIKFNDGIFYLLEIGTNSIGLTSDLKSEKRKQVLNSDLREWLIYNIDDEKINFTTKTAENILGYSFIFNPITENFDKVLANKLNLSTLINKNFDILYTENLQLIPKLFVYNFENKVSIDIPINTFPEKCVWGKDNIKVYCGVPNNSLSRSSLDNWYKGKISFSDDIWEINTNTGKTKKLISPLDEVGENIDVINIKINNDDNYLTFINKKDFNLWGLKLISN